MKTLYIFAILFALGTLLFMVNSGFESRPEPTQKITKWYATNFSSMEEAAKFSHILFKSGWRDIKIIAYNRESSSGGTRASEAVITAVKYD